MFGIGTPELFVILIIVVVLFGGKKIPELSRGIGEAIRELRRVINGDSNDRLKIKSSKEVKKN